MFGKSKCSQTRDLLSTYLNGRLDAKDRRKVEEHLRDCEPCRQELESLRATVSLLRLTPTVAPPRSFVLRESAVASRVQRPAWQGAAVLNWATALAVALLLIVVGGDTISSVALRGFSASAPAGQMIQKSTADKAAAPTDASASNSGGLAAPAAGTSADSQSQATPSAPESFQSAPAGTPTPSGMREAARPSPPPQPTVTSLHEESRPAQSAGLPVLRILEIGLSVVTLILVSAVVVARRSRR